VAPGRGIAAFRGGDGRERHRKKRKVLRNAGIYRSFRTEQSGFAAHRSRTMLPLLSLHALAAQRGDGLRPELLALLRRHAGSDAGLSANIEPELAEVPREAPEAVPNTGEKKHTAET
jgi:hypothetical protein